MRSTETLAIAQANRVLAGAAIAATQAPSVHNTQPWRWLIRGGRAELRAERRRQLTESDPDGRMLVTSCGTALHYACVALAADGYVVDIERVPDPADPDLLARIGIAGRVPVTPEAMRHFQTLEIRRTDRRPLADLPLPRGAVERLRSVAAAFGIGLDVLDRDQVVELAAATGRAQRDQVADAAGLAELDAWSGRHRWPGAGVPDDNIPDHPSPTTVPARDFGHLGTLTGADTHDAAARYAILHGIGDDPGTWLRGGEALSAVWLEAIGYALSVVPLSAAVEAPGTRQELRRILSGVGYPCIAMRVGTADPEQPPPPRTPRLPVDSTVDVIE
ncbi:MAG TPA: nitroreductase [Micromonosporaceae bacterium]|nr:nitroreductase [Micromonosporaceae bacterium]